jgi:hypothetical protein
MVRWQFKSIYWSMFITNLFVLFLGSWLFTKGQDAFQSLGRDSPKGLKRLKQHMFLCMGLVAVSMVIVVMEAFALLALEFCDGEDLMSLYWSSWMMTQVGSLIAIVGIVLAMLHSLWDRRHPPWALALGTPVLVIAGIMNLLHDCTKRRLKQMRKSPEPDSDEENAVGPPMSQVNTITVAPEDDESIHGEFIGFTVEGGPIVRFNQPQDAKMPDNTELLGYCDSNRPIVAYRKDSIRLFTDAEKPATTGEPSLRKTEKESEAE